MFRSVTKLFSRQRGAGRRPRRLPTRRVDLCLQVLERREGLNGTIIGTTPPPVYPPTSSVSAASGVLSIIGSGYKDEVTVQYAIAPIGSPNPVVVSIATNGAAPTSYTYPASSVSRIDFTGNGGDDELTN